MPFRYTPATQSRSAYFSVAQNTPTALELSQQIHAALVHFDKPETVSKPASCSAPEPPRERRLARSEARTPRYRSFPPRISTGETKPNPPSEISRVRAVISCPSATQLRPYIQRIPDKLSLCRVARGCHSVPSYQCLFNSHRQLPLTNHDTPHSRSSPRARAVPRYPPPVARKTHPPLPQSRRDSSPRKSPSAALLRLPLRA